MRQVVLDTETTGLRPEEGHRIIEIGCLEMIDRKLTGKQFHRYINPERQVEEGALAVHGITDEFLQDKPVFMGIAHELIEFITGAELIIHNAPFDIGFINHELSLLRQGFKSVSDYCKVLDTLALARQLHAGQRNSLDALCKRYGIDLTKRNLHGALLDACLLVQVYLAMTGGQGTFFDILNETHTLGQNKNRQSNDDQAIQRGHLVVLKASRSELKEHDRYLDMLKKQGKCLWESSD